MLGDVLRNAVRRPRDIGPGQSGSPALEFAFFARVFDAPLHVAHRLEVFIEFDLVGSANAAAQVTRVGQNCIQNALFTAARFVLEQSVEGERRINLQRRWGGGRAPRNMRAVEHRIILVDGRVGFFAAEHEARHLGRAAVTLGQQLIDAGAGMNLASRSQRRARQQVAGL